MRIFFPGGKKIYADFKGFTHKTDQPVDAGGDGSAPQPFDLFLVSLGTCAGIYVLGFCQQRGLDTEGLEIIQTTERDPEVGRITAVNIEIRLPKNFPEKYVSAVIRSAELCAVKRVVENPPRFDIVAHRG